MSNLTHLSILKQGVKFWNEWRIDNPTIMPDLTELYFDGDLRGVNFRNTNLSKSHLTHVKLSNADCHGANFSGTDLTGADLSGTEFSYSNLTGAMIGDDAIPQVKTIANSASFYKANLTNASLFRVECDKTDFRYADLTKATLINVSLTGSLFVGTILEESIIEYSNVYGISVWDTIGIPASQKGLSVSPSHYNIRVDDLKMAQFINLIVQNEQLHDVINTTGGKCVLVLGRFTDGRKIILEEIRKKLQQLGFVPIIFDFDTPENRDFTEMVKILTGLSKFIIADITNPRSSPLELQATIPDFMIPFVPIIHEGEEPFPMFKNLRQKYSEWVLDVLKYDSIGSLIAVFEKALIKPAQEMSDRILIKKAQENQSRHTNDYL
jgi:uncharacterized protein YjbI with pentapeptide repeats